MLLDVIVNQQWYGITGTEISISLGWYAYLNEAYPKDSRTLRWMDETEITNGNVGVSESYFVIGFFCPTHHEV